jgi:predicted flap endonuclease-1-like 5' DNA nuclease
MRAFKVFIFGLLYGLFVKYAFDRIYRENEMEDIRNENASLREYIRTLESQLQSKPVEMKSVAQPAPRAQSEPSRPGKATAANQKDDLQAIRGIGPVIEKRLNHAGIYTFEALARLSVEELEGILGNARRLAKEGDLISQAKTLAQQNHR